MFNELRAGVSQLDHRGNLGPGTPGGSITNAGRQTYNPTPNNNLGEPGAGLGDEIATCNRFSYPGIASGTGWAANRTAAAVAGTTPPWPGACTPAGCSLLGGRQRAFHQRNHHGVDLAL